jgi:hypothetical protein
MRIYLYNSVRRPYMMRRDVGVVFFCDRAPGFPAVDQSFFAKVSKVLYKPKNDARSRQSPLAESTRLLAHQ